MLLFPSFRGSRKQAFGTFDEPRNYSAGLIKRAAEPSGSTNWGVL